MDFAEPVLVAEVEDLEDEPLARPYADALAYEMDRDDGRLPDLNGYPGELPLVLRTVGSYDERGLSKNEIGRIIQRIEVDAVEAIMLPRGAISNSSSVIERSKREGVTTIITYNDSERTPELQELLSIIDEANQLGDVVYIETTANSSEDALTLLSAIYEATEDGITIGGVALGEIGRHTRVVAPSYGSKLTFAPIHLDSESASSGLIELKELAELIQETEEPSTPVSLHDSIKNPMVRDE